MSTSVYSLFFCLLHIVLSERTTLLTFFSLTFFHSIAAFKQVPSSPLQAVLSPSVHSFIDCCPSRALFSPLKGHDLLPWAALGHRRYRLITARRLAMHGLSTASADSLLEDHNHSRPPDGRARLTLPQTSSRGIFTLFSLAPWSVFSRKQYCKRAESSPSVRTFM